MDKEDLIVSIISLLVLLVFVFNPLFKKFIMKVDKKKADLPPREDPVYQSVESFAQRILNNNKEVKQFRIIQPEIVIPAAEKLKTEKKSVFGRIEKQSALRKAVIWKEILSPPVALKDSDNLF